MRFLKVLVSLLLSLSFLPIGQASANATFTFVSAGSEHTVAIDSSNSVWAWGSNSAGNVGDGTLTQRKRPVKVQGLTDVISVSASSNFTLALKSDGTVWSWGSNHVGQLGDGTKDARLTPVQVQGLEHVTAIATGGNFSMALKSDGTVWVWGGNESGQLADGTLDPRTTPISVNISNVQAITAGASHSLVLLMDGTVWAWGDNLVGQIGNGKSNARSSTPEKLTISNVKEISAGGYHTVAVKNDGTVWAWGRNVIGEVGDGTTDMRTAPVQVNGLVGITSVEGGSNYSLALQDDGTVWAWGSNVDGQLGDGSNNDRLSPVKMNPAGTATKLSASNSHSMVLMQDGTLWGTGLNSAGQLGEGTNSNSNTLIQVTFSSSSANLTNIVLSQGELSPPFSSNTTSGYTAIVGNEVETLSITPTAASANSTITITVNQGNPMNVTSGQTFGPFLLQVGENTVSLKVTSEDLMETKTYLLTITRGTLNHAPVALSGSFDTTPGVAFSDTLVATDSDNDSLSYSIVSNGSLGIVTVTNSATGAFTYTPNNGATGNDSFTFLANDGKVNSNTATVSVRIIPPTQSNHGPIAYNEAYATTVNTAVSGVLRASDPDQDPLMYSIDVNGTKGTATITNSSSGAFTYVPNPGVSGNDQFTFWVHDDGGAASNIATITVTISAPVPSYYPVTDVILDKTRVEMQAGGEPAILHATIKPSYASNPQVTWSSSNPQVASVDAYGKVTPLAAGETIITVTSVDRNISDICRVIVKPGSIAVTEIILDKIKVETEENGEPFKIKATVIPENATNQKIVWSSSNKKVAVVDETGMVTPLAKGTAAITAKTEDGKKTAKCVVKVNKSEVIGLGTEEETIHLVTSKTKVLQVYATMKDGSKKNITTDKATTIENLSSDLVTVKKNVLKAGKIEGNTKIKVTYKGKSITIPVIVMKAGVSKLTVSQKEVTLTVNESKQISVFAVLTDKTKVSVTEWAKWTSDHPETVSIKDGVLTAHQKGIAQLKASYGGKNVSITVNVK